MKKFIVLGSWILILGSVLVGGCGTTSSDTTTTLATTTTTAATTTTTAATTTTETTTTTTETSTSTTTTSTTTTSTTTTTIDWTTYYPETQGLTRVYSVEIWCLDGDEVHLVTEEVSARTTVNTADRGIIEARKLIIDTCRYDDPSKSGSEECFFNTTAASTEYIPRFDGDYYVTELLSYPLSVEAFWLRGDRIDNDIPGPATAEVIGPESITVRAQPYETWKVLYHCHGLAEDDVTVVDTLIYSWFAPAVGKVKEFQAMTVDGTLYAVTTIEVMSVTP